METIPLTALISSWDRSMDVETAKDLLGLQDDRFTSEQIHEAYNRRALRDMEVSIEELHELTRARDLLLSELKWSERP